MEFKNIKFETFPESKKEQNELAKVAKVKYTTALGEMMERVKNEPKQRFIYSGIKEYSLGVIYGAPKSGKSSYAECLAMAIASGEKDYLGLPIDIDNKKVLVISLEEHYTGRTERNSKQSQRLIIKHGIEWLSNYIVVNEEMPTFIEDEKDWKIIENAIKDVQPGFVIIDSLTRLCAGVIEESKSARELMKRLRELLEQCKTTICIIHHSHKLYDKPLLRDTMAGSRVVGQEFDFIIGINKTDRGIRYIKEVDFRYSIASGDKVKTFEFDSDCYINLTGEADEYKLLSADDGRHDDTNRDLIYEHIVSTTGTDGTSTISTAELQTEFVPDIMTRTTMFNILGKFVREGKIMKLSKGQYRLAA